MITARFNLILILICLLTSHKAFLQNVGIGTETPIQKLDVNGGLRIGTTDTANTGAIRWNETKNDFEGYNGVAWVSLTGGKGKWGNQLSYSTENDGSEVYLVYSENSSIELGADLEGIGDWLIVGAYRDGVPANIDKWHAGSIRLFHRDGDTWAQVAVAFDPDATTNDFFGYSVGMTPTHIITGAQHASLSNAQQIGKAYIYTYPNSTLSLQATLMASDAQDGDLFGYSNSMYGDYAIIGAPANDILAFQNMGRAYIFTRNGTNWNQSFMLTPSDGAANDGFGGCVKMWGDYVAVASPNKTINGFFGAGKVYVYKRNGSTWSLIQQLISPNPNSNERFGQELEIRDSKLFIGAPDNVSSNGDETGKVYVYQIANSTITYETTLIPSDGSSSDGFGSSLDFLDNTLLVGSPKASPGATMAGGKAYLYETANNQWTEVAKLKSSREEIGMRFGKSAALVPGYAIVGAPFADLQGNPDNGQVFFFKQH